MYGKYLSYATPKGYVACFGAQVFKFPWRVIFGGFLADIWRRMSLHRLASPLCPKKEKNTCDTWHLKCDTWWGVNILSKFQLRSSFGFGGNVIWRSGGKGSLTRSVNQSVNQSVTKLFIKQPRLGKPSGKKSGLVMEFFPIHNFEANFCASRFREFFV